MERSVKRARRASGSLFGLALGDALAAKTEFMRDVEEIERRFGKGGPTNLPDPARVTDDTQMTLAVGEALLRAEQSYRPEKLEGLLRETFVAWLHDPENNRAPGMTCLGACAALERGESWRDATRIGSKGCGANMRVAPVGLLSDISAAERAAIAQFQAALTHGHPTALAASDLTAFAIADLLVGDDLAGLPGRLRKYALSQREVYHQLWLGRLWQRAYAETPQAFIARGWDECLGVLERLEVALRKKDRASDPCLATGEGWIAEEAFATGLLCFLLFPDDPIAAIRRAAVTSGDSDSLACLTGAFAGAYWGLEAWPGDWVARVEYQERLEVLGMHWDR
jgi:ADP-ribosylglycohydrolase